MKARPYQTRAIDHVRGRRGKYRLCYESPTGSGKTFIMAELLRDPCRQVVQSPSRVLLDQISKVLTAHGVGHGFRAANRPANPRAAIQLCMAQTEIKRLQREGIAKNIDRVHIDELHRQRGPAFRNVLKRYTDAGASLIGYSATPCDLTGLVDEVFRVATVPELIQGGYLCPPRVFSCGQPDLKALDKLRRDSNGEYLAGDVNKLVQPQVIFGRVLENYRKLSPDGRPFILYAHSVKASLWWAQMLTAKGIPMAHIDGEDVWVDGKIYKSDTAKRDECFERITAGDLQGLSNRFVLREGVDLPAIGHVINTCPVGARKTWVQMCGRALRPYPNREYSIIQDHSGSADDHPPLDSAYPWDWRLAPGLAEKIYQSKMRNNTEPEPITCPKCCGLRNAGDTCPYCGFQYKTHSRYVIQSDGTLRLVEGRKFIARETTARPGDDAIWKRMYWRTVKNGNRTAEQAYAYFAYSNNWRWLPRTLPLMPANEGDWFIPLKDVPKANLIGA